MFRFESFTFLQEQLNESNENSKQSYYSELSSKLLILLLARKRIGPFQKPFQIIKKFPEYLLCFMKINL